MLITSSRFGLLLTLGLCLTLLFSGCAHIQKSPVIHHDLPQQINMRFSWTGQKAYTVREEFKLTLMPNKKSYHSSGFLRLIPLYGGLKTKAETYSTVIPITSIQTLLKAIHQESWLPATRPAEVINHTDDYPNRVVEVFDNKKKAFQLMSSSNTAQGIPFNLLQNHLIFSTMGLGVSTAVNHLFAEASPSDGRWNMIKSDTN